MNEIQDIIEIKPTDELLELRRRNEQRANEIKTSMGSKWVLHPSNHVQRKQDAYKPILSRESIYA